MLRSWPQDEETFVVYLRVLFSLSWFWSYCFSSFFLFLDLSWTLFAVLSLTIICFFETDIFLYAFNCFVYRERAKITGFLSSTKKINIIIYALLLCRHEHCSIDVCESLSVELTWCIVFHWNRTVLLGILELVYAANFVWFLLFFVFQCDSNRLIKPVRKALLIIPAEVCVCVYVWKVRIGQSANHNGAFLFFLPSSSKCLRVTLKPSRTSWFSFSKGHSCAALKHARV